MLVSYILLALVLLLLSVLCVRSLRTGARASDQEAELAAERSRAEQAVALLKAAEETCRKRLADKEKSCRDLLDEKDAACRQQLADRDAHCRRVIEENRNGLLQMMEAREKAFDATVKTLEEKFANLAEQKLKASSAGLSSLNEKQLGEILLPFKDQLEKLRAAFEANKDQQIRNKASFDEAIANLGARALQIGADAENLAKALKSESKTQGDWGEMVLGNILSAAGLKEGRDYLPQEQETDAAGNKLIPDVEIPLPNKEKLLIDSKASVTAYLDYVAAQDDAARESAVKEHVASVRRHMEELAEKDYIKKIKGSQGYILMFIPNEGSYLLAMERDRKLATDAFRRHVIIVNPTTLLLCLQIVALLRAREAQNENAERISLAAAKMYEKFAGFSDSFADLGKRLEGLAGAYRKANGQLCEGNANVVKQLESLKGMGVVTVKTINEKLLADALDA